MRFNEGAGLDTSEISDRRGFGGGRMVAGGGGVSILGLLVYLFFGGGLDTGGDPGAGLGMDHAREQGQHVDNGDLAQECRTGADANRSEDCATVATINSIQDYWSSTVDGYRKATTTFFTDGVDTGCGSATSDVGPFYCPADSGVYIDLAFFDQLRTQFGAQGGNFAEAYVLAHEYGHHVQNLVGTSDRVGRATGPDSDAVRLELQADCYAGVWAHNATRTPTENGEPLISEITADDVRSALDTAEKIGDDYIQSELGGGRVDESKFSHGSSDQREKWLARGMRSGDPNRCDTFGASSLG